MDNGFEKRLALLVQNAGELDDENAVRDHDAGHHDDTHQRHDVQRGAGKEQDQNHADESGRKRHENDERIDEGAELRDEDEIDKQYGDDQAKTEVVKRLIHLHNGAAQGDYRIAVVAGVCEQLVNASADGLQSLGFGGD